MMKKNCLKVFKNIWAKQVNNLTAILLYVTNNPVWWYLLFIEVVYVAEYWTFCLLAQKNAIQWNLPMADAPNSGHALSSRQNV